MRGHRRLVALVLALGVIPAVSPSAPARADDDLREELHRALDRQKTLEEENRKLRETILDLLRRVDERDGAQPTTSAEPAPPAAPPAVAEAPPAKPPHEHPWWRIGDPSGPGGEWGLAPRGGGMYWKGEDYVFRIMAYAQVVGTVFDNALESTRENLDFSIRRARLDVGMTFYDDYELFAELEGGAGTVAASDSDFGLVAAYLNIRLWKEYLQVRGGKLITWFSRENSRSSRALDTIERYAALNSLFLLPAIDSQVGALVYGTVGGDHVLRYYLGVYNGNGTSNANFRDNNTSKELQAGLSYNRGGTFEAGLNFDYSREEAQTLSVVDLAFNRWISVPIQGRRYGFTGDFFWNPGRFSLRGEGLAMRFERSGPGEVGLYGGFLQPAYFLYGNTDGGVQVLLRGEISHLDAPPPGEGDTLWAATAGLNWFLNPNIRLQLNVVTHYFDGPSRLQSFDDARWIGMVLSGLQVKF